MDEAETRARDAYSSATILALLVAATTTLNAVAQRSLDLGPSLQASRAALFLVAAGALVYLGATRHRPRPGAGLVICLLLLLPVIPSAANAALRWQALGRPWEAFPPLQLAIMSMALIVPGSFRLGVILVAVFTVETVLLVLWFQRAGMGAAVPGTEPFFTVVVAMASIGLLRMREQRRQATHRYLVAQGETLMLARLNQAMQEARMGFAASTRALLAGVEALAHEKGGPAVAERMRGALGRLAALNGQLEHLDIRGSTSSERVNVDEERFLAREEHDSVLLFAVMMSLLAAVGAEAMRDQPIGAGRMLYPALSILCVGCVFYLFATRKRPSPARSAIVFLAISLPIFGFVAYLHVQAARMTTPIELFTGPKLVMAIIPLVMPRWRWLGLALVALMGLEALALYEILDFGSQKHRIAMAEPWLTMIYCAVGIGLVLLRDQRRSASIRLLRAEADLAALTRHSDMLLAILDETGSPLQVLALAVGLLKSLEPSSPVAQRMSQAIEEFSAARRQLTKGRLGGASGRLSFDAAAELRERHAELT